MSQNTSRMRFLKTHFGEGRAASPPSADLQQLGLMDSAPGADKDPRLEVALWGAGLGLWETDFRTDLTRWYDDWCERIDLDPCEGHDHAARWDEYVHPDDRSTVTARLGAHLIGADEFYQADLIGCAAFDTAGTPLGLVHAVHDFGAGTLLELRRSGAEPVLLPFTEAVVPEVDIAARRIRVDPPSLVGDQPQGAGARGDAA